MNRTPLLEAYKRLCRRLREDTLFFTGAREEVEDAVQDAFCRLWQKGYTPEDADDGQRLLHTAVKHRLQKEREKQQRRSSLLKLWGRQKSPPDETEVRDTLRYVEQLVERELSPLQREILRRHEYEDESYRQIADTLGMTETAVMMQMSRARKKIRDIYKKTVL